MDKNKARKLLQIGYKIQQSCGTCKHGQFSWDAFGVCSKFEYQHGKHTGEPRQLSIHRYGWCPSYTEGDKHVALWKFKGDLAKRIQEIRDDAKV